MQEKKTIIIAMLEELLTISKSQRTEQTMQPDFESVKQQLTEAIDKMHEIKVKHNIDEKRHSFALYTKES